MQKHTQETQREYIAHVLAAYDADPSLSEADSHRYHSYPFVRIFAFSRISTETLKRIEKGVSLVCIEHSHMYWPV